MARTTVDQLAARYTDAGWRARFVDFCRLMEMLGDCLIDDSYKVSDALNEAISLSPTGVETRKRVITRSQGDKTAPRNAERVQPKDATLMLALTVGHEDLFVNLESTNLPKLEKALDYELKQGRIRFPFVFGRDLYDLYAGKYSEPKEFLNVQDTQKLLADLPAGVFQYGPYTIGPYGLHRSRYSRSIPATRDVPAYHCVNQLCTRLHYTALSTSQIASINRDRKYLQDLLEDSGEESAEWWGLAAEVGGYSDAYFKDQRSATVVPLIGDALSENELRVLFANLYEERTQGRMKSDLTGVVAIDHIDDFVGSINRPELLQLLLFASDPEIITAIDTLTAEKKIVVPPGEVRKPVTHSALYSGAFRLRSELGSRGVRFVSDDPGISLLRERRLLGSLYKTSAEDDRLEFLWQLRSHDVEDPDERLEAFFQSESPREALHRLALARRSNLERACENVGLTADLSASDEHLVEAILWKLGFDIDETTDPHSDFWGRHEALFALAKSPTAANATRLRDAAAPYFAQVEKVLSQSLSFTSWALTFDHLSSEHPFTYNEVEDGKVGLRVLQGVHDASSDKKKIDYLGERVDLGDLVNGFKLLTRHLRDIERDRTAHSKDPSTLPEFAGKTDLKEFVFRSKHPFLDLSAPSQERIKSALMRVADVLIKAEVARVRNDYSHYRRQPPPISELEDALSAVYAAVQTLESNGFCTLPFAPQSIESDRWGKSRYLFLGPRSQEHVFTRPTRFDWQRLPSLNRTQFLMRTASLEDSSEVLRFTPRYHSEYSDLWAKYPNRRKKAPSVSSDESTDGREAPKATPSS